MKMNSILVKIGLFLVLVNGVMAMSPSDYESKARGAEKKQNISIFREIAEKPFLQKEERKDELYISTKKKDDGTVFNLTKNRAGKTGTVFNNAK